MSGTGSTDQEKKIELRTNDNGGSTDQEKKIELRTNDNGVFSIKESAAIQSVTLKNIIENDDCSTIIIPLPNVDSKTLNRTIEYLNKHDDKSATEDDLKNFDSHFFDGVVSNEEIFETALAANYLEIKGLLDISCQFIADMIKDKSPEYVRALFSVENDFTPEEEAAVRNENLWVHEE